MPKIEAIKRGVELQQLDCPVKPRPIVAVSLGPILMGTTLFHTDPGDRDTMIAGALKRFLARLPRINTPLVRRFNRHVRRRLREEFVPLCEFHDFSIETWLAASNYPDWRKQEILAAWEENYTVLNDEKTWKVKSFMKDEGYMDIKHARGINSRTDAFKALVGPLFHAIETVVFQHPVFVKYVPVRKRAEYLWDSLWTPEGKYIATDYTTFEASFIRVLMMSCEFELYLYMLRHTPEFLTMLFVCWVIIGGRNVCTFRYFIVWVFATRMSGEMCTSCGNGFSNWMLCDFVCHESGTNYVGRFEGDDGLARIWGSPIQEGLFAELGMKIKLLHEPELSEASFCGLIFDPVDKAIVTDPIKVLASFGWGKAEYRGSRDDVLLQLLKAKSLSFLYQYPGCPIITELAKYGLRMTLDKKIRKTILERYGWKRDVLEEALAQDVEQLMDTNIGMNTRILVENKFGVSVEVQLEVEAYLRNKVDLEPLLLPLIVTPPNLQQYNEDYVVWWPVGDDDFIGDWWEKMQGFEKEWL